jgi:hypothetical protein
MWFILLVALERMFLGKPVSKVTIAASFADTENQCYVNLAEFSHLVCFFKQGFFSSVQPLASSLRFVSQSRDSLGTL